MSWRSQPQQNYSSVQMNAPRSRMAPQLHNNYYNGNASFRPNNFQSAPKPTNLSNSAVQQSYSEKKHVERKKVIWPPPPDDYEIIDNYQNGYGDPKPHHTLLIKKETKPFEPPPQYIHLQEAPPLVQNSTPVYKSQPISNTYYGITRSTGDQKWPPQEYRSRTEADNKPHVDLVRTPQSGSKTGQKNYNSFVSRNAIPNTYPGYTAPPGTQHHFESDYQY